MAGAYTLRSPATYAHVLTVFSPARGDIDLILSSCFSFPLLALTYLGHYYAPGRGLRETSNINAEGPPIYPFKRSFRGGRDPAGQGIV